MKKKNFLIMFMIIFCRSLYGTTLKVSNLTDKTIYFTFEGDLESHHDQLGPNTCRSIEMHDSSAYGFVVYKEEPQKYSVPAITRNIVLDIGLKNRNGNIIVYKLPGSDSLHIFDY